MSLFKAYNNGDLLSFQKRKEVAIAYFFPIKELAVQFLNEDGICIWSCQQSSNCSLYWHEKSHPFFQPPKATGRLFVLIRHLPLLDNITGKVISLQHCSSRNRKTLHHIVHILKFLAWLSKIIEQNAPKLVSQWSVIQILRDQDLSKEICVDIRNLRNEIYQDWLIVAK